VRTQFNQLIGIKRDKAVAFVHPSPTPSEVQRFERGRGDGPTAAKFRLQWGQGRSSQWNAAASRIFTKEFKRLQEQAAANNPDYEFASRVDIEEMFFDRLSRLSRIVRGAVPKDLGNGCIEEVADVISRLHVKTAEVNERQRPTSRRRTVSVVTRFEP
jgi:hypothetical protein